MQNTQFAEHAPDTELEENAVVSLREKICYGLGDTACNVVFGICATLLTFFYTDYIGINPMTVGMIFLISRFFDGISDVVMGFITDRTHSKYGKARPWILWMSVPYAVTFVLLFLYRQMHRKLYKLCIFLLHIIL